MKKISEWRLFDLVECGDIEAVAQAVKSGLSLAHFTAMSEEIGVLDVAFLAKNKSPQRAKIWNMLQTERKRLMKEELLPVLNMALVSLNKQEEDSRYQMPEYFKEQMKLAGKTLTFFYETDEWRPTSEELFRSMVKRVINELYPVNQGVVHVSNEELAVLDMFASSYGQEAERIRSLEEANSSSMQFMGDRGMYHYFGGSKDLFENVYCLNVEQVAEKIASGMTFSDFIQPYDGDTIMQWAYWAQKNTHSERDKEGLQKANQIVSMLEQAQKKVFYRDLAPMLSKIEPFLGNKIQLPLPEDTNTQLNHLAKVYSEHLDSKIEPLEALVRGLFQMKYAVEKHELPACSLDVLFALNNVAEAVKRDNAALSLSPKQIRAALKLAQQQRRARQRDNG